MFRTLCTLAMLAFASPALAHHPLNGLPMDSLADGILSGIGHPLLGFDHLFFVLLAGVASAKARIVQRGIGAYLLMMALGCWLVSRGLDISGQEPMILTSLLLLGGLVAYQQSGRALLYLGLLALFGLFHGAAFGETITAAEITAGPRVLAGYLAGLIAVQWLMAASAGAFARRLPPLHIRLAGAMALGAGMVLGLDALEGPLVRQLIG